MITDLPTLVILLLVVLTVLGAIMGYCVAVIRVKQFAHSAIDEARREIEQGRIAAQPEIPVTKHTVDQSRAGQPQAPAEKQYDASKVKALVRRSLKQAKRIKALEARLALMKAERTRLKQQSALGKSTKAGEPRRARASSNTEFDKDNVPILSRRVKPASTQRTKKSSPMTDATRTVRNPSTPRRDEIQNSLNAAKNTPVDSESKRSESVGEPESDVIVAEDGGAGSRG